MFKKISSNCFSNLSIVNFSLVFIAQVESFIFLFFSLSISKVFSLNSLELETRYQFRQF